MKPSRRGILGGIAVSPLAAAAASEEMAKMQLSEATLPAWKGTYAGSITKDMPFPGIAEAYEGSWMERQFKRAFGNDVPVILPNMQHPVLDVDLAVNRSMSLPMKYAIQRKRIHAMQLEHARFSIMREVRQNMSWMKFPQHVLDKLKDYVFEDD